MIGMIRDMPHRFLPINLPGSVPQKRQKVEARSAKHEPTDDEIQESSSEYLVDPFAGLAENMTKDRFIVDEAAQMIKNYQFTKAITTLDARRMHMGPYTKPRCELLRSYAWFCLGSLEQAKGAARAAKNLKVDSDYLDSLLDGSLDDVHIRPKPKS